MQKTIHTQSYQTLILWLKECRETKGYSMRDVGEKLGVSHSWVGKVEQMERRLDVYEYVQLCEVLGVDAQKGIGPLLSQQ